MTRDDPPSRAVVAIGTYALEVGLGTLLGAVGVYAATWTLGQLRRDVAMFVIGALALWCALLGGAVRVARASRGRLHPAVGFIVIALPALGLVGPVVLHVALTRDAGMNPFSGWAGVLDTVKQVSEVGSLVGALIVGASIPFLLVGAPVAARRPAPWTVAVLGACGGYLGLVATFSLIEQPPRGLVLGFRHALLLGVPFAVIGMTVVSASRPGGRRLKAVLLAVAAATPPIGITLREHHRHLAGLLLRDPDGAAWNEGHELVEPRGWIAHLSSPLPHSRMNALSMLAHQGPRAVAAAPALLLMVQDDDHGSMRRPALLALGAVMQGSAGDVALWKAVVDVVPHETLGTAAQDVLLSHGHPVVAEALLLALEEPRSRLERDELFFTLGRWWLTHHEDSRTREAVTVMLKKHIDLTGFSEVERRLLEGQ